jgi:hypothetical protein
MHPEVAVFEKRDVCFTSLAHVRDLGVSLANGYVA